MAIEEENDTKYHEGAIFMHIKTNTKFKIHSEMLKQKVIDLILQSCGKTNFAIVL